MGKASTKVVISAIVGNGFITFIKFVGWFFSKSPSMLAEAIHSLADTLNQLLLLVGIKQSLKLPTREHPSGSGEMQYVWNLISAVVIFFIGFGVTLYHGIHSLILPAHAVGDISWITISVLITAFIIEFVIFLQALKEVNRQKGDRGFLTFLKESDDPTIMAVLLEDGVAVLGVLLAMSGIFLGQIFQSNIFDSITAIIISFLLGFMAVALALINGKLLIGKSVAFHKEDEYRKFIQNFKEVESINSLTTQVIGAGKARLTVELRLHGESLIDYKLLYIEADKIKAGEEPVKILLSSTERMVRLTTRFTNKIQIEIQKRFPEIVMVDLEII